MDVLVIAYFMLWQHLRKNICVGRESNPDQLLGRQLC